MGFFFSPPRFLFVSKDCPYRRPWLPSRSAVFPSINGSGRRADQLPAPRSPALAAAPISHLPLGPPPRFVTFLSICHPPSICRFDSILRSAVWLSRLIRMVEQSNTGWWNCKATVLRLHYPQDHRKGSEIVWSNCPNHQTGRTGWIMLRNREMVRNVPLKP